MATNQIVPVKAWGFLGFPTTINLEITPKTHLGVINRNAEVAFNSGQCHSLAYAVNRETGWPILGIGDLPDGPNHLVVYHPGIDEYIDIQGVGALKRGDHASWANEMIREITPEQVEEGLATYLKMNYLAAKPFAKSLLNRIKKFKTTVKEPLHKEWMNGNKPVYGFVDKAMGEDWVNLDEDILKALGRV
jgi:hypothetical protein